MYAIIVYRFSSQGHYRSRGQFSMPVLFCGFILFAEVNMYRYFNLFVNILFCGFILFAEVNMYRYFN